MKLLKLNKEEYRLIKFCRELEYGELHLFIQDSKPVRAMEAKKSIRFDIEVKCS